MALVYERVVEEDLNVGTGAVNVSAPGGGTLASTQISLSSFALGQLAIEAGWVPGEVASGSKASTTVTVTGAVVGDFALASFDIDLQEMQLSASVISANTVEVTLYNLTGAAVTLGGTEGGTLKVVVFSVRS